jgi:hypothetical protein
MWQTASDFIIFLGWVFKNSTLILGKVFLPIQYVYTYLKQFFINAFASPSTPETIWAFDTGTKSIFNSIPYFNVMISVAVLGTGILIIVFILKQFVKV